jgi:hypothetical protein
LAIAAPGAITFQSRQGRHRLSVQLVNAKPAAPEPESATLYRSNYFIGADSANWRRDVTSYSALRYRNAYPGVDMLLRLSTAGIAFELEAAPHSNPALFGLRFDDAASVGVDRCGELVAEGARLQLRASRPRAYQVNPLGDTLWRRVMWRLAGNATARLALGEFDPSLPLVVDPVLAFSTYLGGAQAEYGKGVAVDAGGNSYLVGLTASTDFPTLSPQQPALSGSGFDVFVSKFSPAGVPLFSTYVGGTGSDEAGGIAVDASGGVVVVGGTDGTDFPTTAGAYQTSSRGRSDAFVFKLSPTGNALVFSTYVGGALNDGLKAVRLDPGGNVYAVGTTMSSNFPTVGAVQSTNSGNGDALMLKLSATGAALLFSTYIGGSGEDQAYGAAVGPSGDLYVAGQTASPDFPTLNAFQSTLRGQRDAFLLRIASSGSPIRYATYYGGSGFDFGYGVEVDGTERPTLVGYTSSTDLPVRAPLQAVNGGSIDAFVMRMTASGLTLDFATYLGGAGDDYGAAIAHDAAGGILIGGYTASANFPIRNALQTTIGGPRDAFLARLDAAATSWSYSTYFGGSGGDFGTGVAALPSGGAMFVGSTESPNFPTRNAFQGTYRGNSDAFLARIDADSSTTQQPTGYEYVGKLVCGPQPDSLSVGAVRGFYGTIVNIRNPGPASASIRKQVLWTMPPGNETPVDPAPPTPIPASLRAGQGMATDCIELIRRTRAVQGFHDGLLVITSNVPLDVIGVHTAAPLVRIGTSWAAGQVSTMHLDQFVLRRLP